MKRLPRACWLAAAFLLTLTACSPSASDPVSTKVTPPAKPTPTVKLSPPAPTALLQPAPSRLVGASFALPALPAGVPFTGKLLIADRGNGRIIEIGANGTGDWVFPSPGPKVPVRFAGPEERV